MGVMMGDEQVCVLPSNALRAAQDVGTAAKKTATRAIQERAIVRSAREKKREAQVSSEQQVNGDVRSYRTDQR